MINVNKSNPIVQWWLPVLMMFALIPVSQVDFLLFHTLVEFFAIVIAMISAVVAWHTYPLAKNHYLLLLGCGYFYVGGLDFAHTLTFSGMPFVENNPANVSLQFWISARLIESILLCMAPFFITRTYSPKRLIIALTLLTITIFFAVFKGVLPELFIAGKGLTDAKILSEYIIIGMLLASIVTLWMHKKYIENSNLKLMTASIAVTIFAEYSFTLYSDFSSVALITGHILKLVSFWIIYLILIESSLRQPFRNLARNANTYDVMPDETLVVDISGLVRQVNAAVRLQSGMNQQQCIGIRCHDLQHDSKVTEADCIICQHISSGLVLSDFEYFHEKQHQWYKVSLSKISHGENSLAMVHVRRNVTAEKEAQIRSGTFNRLYTVLSHVNKAIANAETEQGLLQDICDISVLYGDFKMAWIGLVELNIVKPQAHAGDEIGYLQQIEVRIDDSALARGPIGRAIKTQKVTCVNNTNTDLDFIPWKGAAAERGFLSLAAVPLTFKGQVTGIYAVYSGNVDAFDEKMLALLDSLGRDISAALLSLHQKQESKQAEDKIQQLSQVVEQSVHAILITDTQFFIEYINRSFTRLTGYTFAEVKGKTPRILRSHYGKTHTYEDIKKSLLSGQKWHGEVCNRRKDDSLYWSKQSIIPIKDELGKLTHFVSTSEDNTDLHNAQETIKQLAFYDPLTDLPNRRLLADRLHQAMEHAQRNAGEKVAVMVFDLDNFKTVNDSLGHNYGDDLLKQVAQIFQSQVRSEDTVSRQGGDEFTIVLSGIKQIDKVGDIADNILKRLSQPIILSGHQVVIGSSIGISIYPDDGENYDELLRHADIAMYHAKEEGKNNFQFFLPEMNQQAHQRLLLEGKLRLAIEQEHFQLFYQPQIDLNSGELIGTEALIRWFDPEEGMISPADFIPLAEDTGLIGQIGDWVIDRACRDMKALQHRGFPKVKVAVNVSAFQFRHSTHLIEVVKKTLDTYEYPANLLALELTESILINDINETICLLNILRELGIGLAIDDFGTGYSSLSYLKQFPIDILKIDQSFIRDISTDESDKTIVSAIIAMANKLGLEVLAEGVETVEHQSFLQEQGCGLAQGYLYCKPVPVDELFSRWQSEGFSPK
jgi:diguanylate cyclase (GGDEF)-like protein/PAS domain S-box-containing protein